MLICFQIPLLDMRPFISEPTGKVQLPAWPSPRVKREFIRSFGPIIKRPLGGVCDNKIGESKICHAHKAIRFGKIPPFKSYRIKCGFRRFFSDGKNVGKYEIGFKVGNSFDVTQPESLNDLIKHILTLPVRIGDSQSYVMLKNVGYHLARHYLASTTKIKFTDFKPYWVQACNPMMVIETLNVANIRNDSFKEVNCQFHDLSQINVNIYQGWVSAGKNDREPVNTWFIFPVYLGNESIYSLDEYKHIRNFRIYLLRFYAEMSCLSKSLLNTKYDLADKQSDKLQWYWNKIIPQIFSSLLTIDTQYGSELARIVQESWDFALPGDRADLFNAIESMRPQIVRKVKEYIDNQSKPNQVVYIKEINVDNSQNITNHGDGAIINQLRDSAQQTFTNSFNTVSKSQADDEVKNKMKELCELITQLAKDTPDEQVIEKAQKCYDTMAKEIASKKPEKNWLELSGKGLIEAAQTCVELVKPISTCVAAILAFF